MIKRGAWFIAYYLLYLLVLLCRRTYRFSFSYSPTYYRQTPRPHIVAVWHQNIIASVLCAQHKSYTMLASSSPDGDVISFILERLGHKMVRGSSRRGGIQAYRNLIHAAQNGDCTAITVDGPTGPRHEVKMGVLRLAQKTGQPILPVTAIAQHFIRFDSWDHFRFPLPFSRIMVCYGEPIFISQEDQDLESKQQQLKEILLAQEKEVPLLWQQPLPPPPAERP